MIKYCLIIIACIYPSVSIGGWLGPSNYDECILESMKGVTSDAAAGAIVRSCRAKFSEKPTSESEVPADVISQLDGRAGMTNYGWFTGTIYNGNNEWTITQLTIVLVPKTKEKSADRTLRAKEYNVNINAPPLTNTKLNVEADGGGSSSFDWNIKSARGHKSR